MLESPAPAQASCTCLKQSLHAGMSTFVRQSGKKHFFKVFLHVKKIQFYAF